MSLSRLLAAFFFVAFASTAPTAVAQNTDPFERSRDGTIECYTPDPVARTCRAMSIYRFQEDGRVLNDAILFIQNNPQVVMYGTTEVYARDGMICGSVTVANMDAAQFTIDGVRATLEEATELRDVLTDIFLVMGEVCTLYVADGDGASARAFLDGVEDTSLTDRVMWIRPEDGYTIGAADASPA